MCVWSLLPALEGPEEQQLGHHCIAYLVTACSPVPLRPQHPISDLDDHSCFLIRVLPSVPSSLAIGIL